VLARNIWNKEIVWCRNARRIQAGEPMTVKETGRRCASAPASFIYKIMLLIG
jgi:hypothetical protein